MKKELVRKLYKAFPNLYQQKDWTIQESCMPWGIETGPGWFGLIYELSEKISKLDPECQASQVKEKFGGLRFYTNGIKIEVADEVYDLISEYEEKSYHVCEECGSTINVTQTQGWIVTLCDKCMKKYKKERGFADGAPKISKSMSKRIKIQKGE